VIIEPAPLQGSGEDAGGRAWAGWMPSYLCREIYPVEHGGRLYWLDMTITAQLIGREPAGGPIPVRADLGRRIADMIRADLAADPEAAGSAAATA
jgi:hypothetical protein